MARDLEPWGKEWSRLKASQEQMAADNAKAAEQLMASHEQMATSLPRFPSRTCGPNSASATADCHPDAQAGTDAPFAASYGSPQAHNEAAARKDRSRVIGATARRGPSDATVFLFTVGGVCAALWAGLERGH